MLYISRHGLRLNKVLKAYKNDPNPPLHHSGIEPLIESSKRIEKLDAVFCSPFIRCVQTAHYLNRHDAPIYVEYGLSETLKGGWYEKNPPFQGWDRSFPNMGHLFSIDEK